MASNNPDSERVQKDKNKNFWKANYRKSLNNVLPTREKYAAFPINNFSNLELNTSTTVNDSSQRSYLNLNGDHPLWYLYFPQENFKTCSSLKQKIKLFESYLKLNSNIYDYDQIKNRFCYDLYLENLLLDNSFKNSWVNFNEDLIGNPQMVLACAGISMHMLILKNLEIINESVFVSIFHTIRPHVHGFSPVVSLRSLRVSNYDRLIMIRGTIIRAGPVEILCTWMAFKCVKCDLEIVVKQPDGIFTTPMSCSKCRAKSNFIPLLSSLYTKTEAFQIIRIQESMLGEQYDSGGVPRNTEVELIEDLVDSICPGDDITLTGILKVKPQEEIQRKKANLYKTYIRAVTISCNKNTITSRKSEFSEKDIQLIERIRSEPCIFRLLVQSLCPMICGREMVKAGLLLGLFGASDSNIGRRPEIHILMVGDPGIGKSQLLQFCANVSPRGMFICGNSSSSAGLTVSIRQERDCNGEGSVLEAGALVLADQGVCCIDEFDKMSSNHGSLLEIMEQQTISVAKAGVLCSLPARTSILAAANPLDGHYDKSKTVLENLKINSSLLSRFDLVFMLLDKPNTHLDNLLASHIQSLHSGEKKLTFILSSKNKMDKSNYKNIEIQSQVPLNNRLTLFPREKLDLLPVVLLQKYIAYAKKNVHPILTSEAAEELKKFYLGLRTVKTGSNNLIVTMRQLEGLIRLAQGRARLELSSMVTLRHAHDVISIVQYSMTDILNTNGDEFKTKINFNGKKMTESNQVKKFIQVLKKCSTDLEKTVFSINELRELAMEYYITMDFSHLIDSINIQGILLKSGHNHYKVYM